MPIHPAVGSRFRLLKGVSSSQEFVEDPALAARREAFEEHPDYAVPAVATQMNEASGPHGSIPVRIYTPGLADGAPCLVWMYLRMKAGKPT